MNRIVRWWRRRRWTAAMFPHTAWVGSRADLPEVLSCRTVYLIGPEDGPKWTLFDCPCGRGHEVQLRMSGEWPVWQATINAGRTQLRPSVDVVDAGGRCHFWLNDGRTVWVWD